MDSSAVVHCLLVSAGSLAAAPCPSRVQGLDCGGPRAANYGTVPGHLMSDIRTERLLAFARRLQNSATFAELLQATREEAACAVGYQNVWFYVAEDDPVTTLRLVEVSSERKGKVEEVARVLHLGADRLIQDLLASDVPIVIPDARADPRTDKDIVERLQNRTIINIPLRLMDKPFGVFGCGTYGDEGCRPPTADELEYLVGMTNQLVVAASRIRFLEMKARAERDRQEFERRLLQAQKLESLGMLAGGIAHDFNNLLTVITVSASLGLQQTSDPSLVAELGSIAAAAARGEALTRQLLAMSRSQELSLKTLDLNVQLRQILALARRILPESIEIEFLEGSGLSLVEGDPSQLDQVFLNLFINARDAMPEGGRLAVETQQVVVNGRYAETHPWARPGRYVLVSIADTGVGMTKEVQERVFEPFFTTKGQRVGTGLGLAVAYGIVRQHRGMLHCYSELGLGTTFKIYLPAAEQLAAHVGSRLERRVPRGEEKVLVAEDDEFVRAAAVRILEKAGYDVTAVEDGESACRAVAASPFDLLVLDVVMPGMTCREVIGRVRALVPQIRILLSSGYTASTSTAALTEQTGCELLSKPYDPDRMLRAVRKALDAPVPETARPAAAPR